MANQPGDIYRIRLKTLAPNLDEALNVFFYRDELGAETGDDAAQEIGLSFVSAVVPEIAGVLHANCIVSNIAVDNLFDASQIYDAPLTVAGSGTGEVLPQFNAVSFRTSRVRGDIRRGQKRFGPVAEGFSLDGILDPASLPLLAPLATALGVQLVSGDTGDIYEPVIVKRIREGAAPGPYTYRLPTSSGEAEYFIAGTWEPVALTSQTSRR